MKVIQDKIIVKEKSEYVRYDISIDGKKTFVYGSRWLSDKLDKEDIKIDLMIVKLQTLKEYHECFSLWKW